MRTQSPYFSPNSAIAPRRSASSRVVSIARTGWLSVTQPDTSRSTAASSSSERRCAVREVEAQLVRADVGAGLAHVVAELAAQRSVQQVGRGVVAHRRQPLGALDDRLGRLARPELALERLQRERLVVAEPVHVDHARAPAGRLDQAAVGDLAAALGVERRLLELGQHPAVGALGDAQHGVRLGRLVADEARAEAGVAGEAQHLVVAHVQLAAGARGRVRAAAPRHLARLLHQLLEALVVDRQALLGEQLLGHLVGEAVGVVQAEGVLRRRPTRSAPRLASAISSASRRSPCSSVRPKLSSSERAQRSIVGHSRSARGRRRPSPRRRARRGRGRNGPSMPSTWPWRIARRMIRRST